MVERGRRKGLSGLVARPNIVTLRCDPRLDRGEPRRAHSPADHPSRAASRPPQDDAQRQFVRRIREPESATPSLRGGGLHRWLIRSTLATLGSVAENGAMNETIHTAQMSVDAFKKIVRDGVQIACKNQGWNETKENERGYAFQKWVGELIVQREGLDTNVDDGMFLSGDL